MGPIARFKRILLLFDPPNPDVIGQTIALARHHSAELTIMDIVDDFGGYQGLLPSTSSEELQAILRDARRAEISSVLEDLGSKPGEVEIKIGFGQPAVEIIREATRGNYDLVVKTAAGPYGLRGMLFGATGLKLIRKCPRPIWIVKPGTILYGPRVLAAVNVFSADEPHRELNRLIVDYAAHIAQTAGGSIDLLYCWQLQGETILSSGRTRLPRQELGRILKITESGHRRRLDEFITEFDVNRLSTRAHFIKGDPGQVIPSFAAEHRIDVLVIGTIGRSGTSGLIIGNTAEKALNQLQCSVLALKPPGFVSPIQ